MVWERRSKVDASNIERQIPDSEVPAPGPGSMGFVKGDNGDQAIIETHELTKAFKTVVAVDGLTLRIRPGEIFGLIGPDGAGKTTTIRLLAAIMDPTAGWARVAGFDTVTEPEPIKRRIGYMAQRFKLYGDL
jgi:ABC-2 type transport system ATP-binding protein